jgi:hypothetical protein
MLKRSCEERLGVTKKRTRTSELGKCVRVCVCVCEREKSERKGKDIRRSEACSKKRGSGIRLRKKGIDGDRTYVNVHGDKGCIGGWTGEGA